MSMSYKEMVCRYMAGSPELDGYKDNKVLIITAFGLVEGKMDTSNENKSTSAMIADIAAKAYLKENSLEVGHRLSGEEGYIPLIDVEIRSGNGVYNFPNLIVFVDQIVGITIGKSS